MHLRSRLFSRWFRHFLNGSRRMEEAEAVILEISSAESNTHPECAARILFNVIPENRRNFIAECRERVPEKVMSGLRTGSKLKIYYDPKTPSRIYLRKPSAPLS